MFLFFEGFQFQNVLILFLFSVKHSYLLTAKIALDVNPPLPNIEYRIQNITNTTLEKCKVIYPIEHPIASQKIALTVFRSSFCKYIFKRNINHYLKSDSHLPKKKCFFSLFLVSFLFILKALFFLKILKFLSRVFRSCGKTD